MELAAREKAEKIEAEALVHWFDTETRDKAMLVWPDEEAAWRGRRMAEKIQEDLREAAIFRSQLGELFA